MALSSKVSKLAAKPIVINMDDEEPDITLVKATACSIVIDLDSNKNTTMGKGKQRAGSSSHPKHNAAQLEPDDEETSAEGKEQPPPSKKTMRTVEPTCMEQLSAAWREKNHAAASAAVLPSGRSISPSGLYLNFSLFILDI
jgi:hypothetical protein